MQRYVETVDFSTEIPPLFTTTHDFDVIDQRAVCSVASGGWHDAELISDAIYDPLAGSNRFELVAHMPDGEGWQSDGLTELQSTVDNVEIECIY